MSWLYDNTTANETAVMSVYASIVKCADSKQSNRVAAVVTSCVAESKNFDSTLFTVIVPSIVYVFKDSTPSGDRHVPSTPSST